MNHPKFHDGDSAPTLRRRLDGWVAGLNVFLLLLAVGLAVVDGTCFLALQVQNLPVSQLYQAPSQLASPASIGPR